jgi:hypothetical protein
VRIGGLPWKPEKQVLIACFGPRVRVANYLLGRQAISLWDMVSRAHPVRQLAARL